MTGHVVVCGLDRIGARTAEQLTKIGVDVLAIVPPGAPVLTEGIATIEGDPHATATLVRAGLETARALVLSDDDDVGNLHIALAAADVAPGVRVVARMFNAELGAQLSSLLGNCIALSASAIAAPTFVASALQEAHTAAPIVLGDHELSLRSDSDGAVLPLLGPGGEPLPAMGAPAVAYLARRPRPALTPPLRPGRARSIALWLSALTGDYALRLVVAVVVLMTVVSAWVFAHYDHLSSLNAIYFTTTILTTTGFGDYNLRGASEPLKIFGIGLMIVGTATFAAMFAVITDAIVSARVTRALGGIPRRLRDHVVVCGVGTVGYRIALALSERGEQVAAIELHGDGPLVATARRAGIPVLIGDASHAESLRSLHVGRARAVVVATDNDLANLEAALNARLVNPDARVVLRLFDSDLAERVEQTLRFDATRSVAALTAPAFAAAALGAQALFPVGDEVLLLAERPVPAGARAVGGSIATLDQAGALAVLALHRDEDHRWRPASTTVIAAGDRIAVVATLAGLERFTAAVDA